MNIPRSLSPLKEKKFVFFQRPFRTFQHKARLSVTFSCKKLREKPNGKKFTTRTNDPMTLLIRRKISLSNLGKKKTEKIKTKIKNSLTGRKLSKQHIQKIKQKMLGEGNPNFGKKKSRITKKKISRSLISRKKF